MTIREPVPQGPLKTPFYPRVEKLDTVNQWHEWKGFSSPDALYCEDLEYFAIRNSTGVFDLSPMTKYRITDGSSYQHWGQPFCGRFGVGQCKTLFSGGVACERLRSWHHAWR